MTFFQNLNKWLKETDKKLGTIKDILNDFKNLDNFSYKITEDNIDLSQLKINISKININKIKTNRIYDGYISLYFIINNVEYHIHDDYIRNDYIDLTLNKKMSLDTSKKLKVIFKDENNKIITIEKGILYINII